MSDKILIVDDDPKVLEILNTSLTRKGHDVHLAQTGEEALTIYKEREPDLLVLDIILPDMDGRDVLRILRSSAGAKELPVLVLSACSDPDVMDSLFACGAQDFLVKPFSLREFNAKVRKVLESGRTTRELKEMNEALEVEVTEQQHNLLETNKELKRQLLAMRTLFALSQDINRRLDLEEMINGFALTMVGQLQISSMAVFSIQRERDNEMSLVGLKGFDKARIEDLRLSRKSSFAKSLLAEGYPQKLVRRKDSEWVNALPDVRLAIFEYVTPIIVKQKLKGLVFTGPKIQGRDYSEFDLDMLQSVCNSAGIGMENARLFNELQNTYLSTVRTLVSIIEAKDAYTKGHTERVAEYSVALGAKLKLSRETLRDLAFGAVLHDIGKLLVLEKVLNKPGNLDHQEWETLKQHPDVGASIIENMEFLSGTVPMVRHHHERWDGAGYPAGLRGESIPIGARIIAVADSYDAMTTDRSYRKALGRKTALRTLKSKSGSQFDPEVVDAFIELIEDDGFVPRDRKKPHLKPTTA